MQLRKRSADFGCKGTLGVLLLLMLPPLKLLQQLHCSSTSRAPATRSLPLAAVAIGRPVVVASLDIIYCCRCCRALRKTGSATTVCAVFSVASLLFLSRHLSRGLFLPLSSVRSVTSPVSAGSRSALSSCFLCFNGCRTRRGPVSLQEMRFRLVSHVLQCGDSEPVYAFKVGALGGLLLMSCSLFAEMLTPAFSL